MQGGFELKCCVDLLRPPRLPALRRRFISWDVVLSRHLRSRNRSKERLHGPSNGLRPCHREVHLPEIDLTRHKLKGNISLAITHGLRRHNLAFRLLPAVPINQQQLLSNPNLWLQRHHPTVPAYGKRPCLGFKFPAALRRPVDNEVHAQCHSGRPTAFDAPEMLCSHSGPYLLSGMIWPASYFYVVSVGFHFARRSCSVTK